MTAITIADSLEISITALLQVIPEMDITAPAPANSKWDTEAMRKFIFDYNSMDIGDLCQKYSITPRTAQEYNKNFVREFEW